MRTGADDIVAQNVPDVDVPMGYDDGSWPDADALQQRFPGKRVWRITVRATDNEGDVLDVEKGDASPGEAPGWVYRRRLAGHGGPAVYCDVSTWPVCRQAFTASQVPEPHWFVAAWGQGPTITPAWIAAGVVAKQHTSTPNYDLSTVVDFVAGIDQEVDDVTDQDKQQIVDGVHTLLDEFWNNQFHPKLAELDSRIQLIESKLGITDNTASL